MQTHQQGAAVITAMFIVVLSTLVISPLVWTLFASAKSIQVFSALTQAIQIAISGIDWVRVILREDARSSTTDHLNELWALPLADTTLNESLMRDTERIGNIQDRNVTLHGQVLDAQARFNLRNLGMDAENQKEWLKAFDRLTNLLDINQEQKSRMILALNELFPKSDSDNEENKDNNNLTETILRPIVPLDWHSFCKQYQLSEDTFKKLSSFVTILPNETTVNLNTADKEVIFSVLLNISKGQVQQIMENRLRVTFNDLNDVRTLVPPSVEINETLVDVKTNFFLVQGEVNIDNSEISSSALLERNDDRVFIIWRKN